MKLSNLVMPTLIIVIISNIILWSVILFMISGTITCYKKINEMRTNGIKIEEQYGNILIPSNVTVYLVNGTLYSKTCYKEDMNPLRGLYFDDTKEIFIQVGNDSDVYLYHELLHYNFKNILNYSTKKKIKKEYKVQCEDADEYYAYLNSNIYAEIK